MPFFFVPLTTLALGAVNQNEVASAAGLMNFLRTMSGAVATAIGVTMWENGAQTTRDTLTGVLNGTGSTMQSLQSRGFSVEQSRQFVSQLVDGQAIAITTINLFELFAALFVGAALKNRRAHERKLGDALGDANYYNIPCFISHRRIRPEASRAATPVPGLLLMPRIGRAAASASASKTECPTHFRTGSTARRTARCRGSPGSARRSLRRRSGPDR
jgi:hypothetical protein